MSETTTVFGEDLVLDILLSLPCKALTRFKCVSKGWYALINSPWFVAKHLSFLNSKNSNLSNLMVMKTNYKDDSCRTFEGEVAFSLLNLRNRDDESIESGEDRIIVSSVEYLELPLSLKMLTRGCRGYMMGHCNGIICLFLKRWVLWNPSIQDYKLLPPSPNCSHEPLGIQGFGYDAKLNDYKLVSFALGPFSRRRCDTNLNMLINRPKAVIYSLSSDSWKEINTNSLETETTFFQPKSFQIQFKEMFYWFGDERLKDLSILSENFLIVKPVIISLDIHNEVFYDILFPDNIYERIEPECMTLRVWNDSLALFASVFDHRKSVERNGKFEEYYGIWVMDELGGPTGAHWTKLVTIEHTEKPLALGFLNTNDIPLGDFMGFVCSYELGSKRIEEEIFRQNSPYTVRLPDNVSLSTAAYAQSSLSATAYVKSIVTVSGAHKLDIRDNYSVVNFSPHPYLASSPSIADKEWHSYSIWVIPPYDVSLRIKRVMESLRTEFGGPQIEPHIPIAASIRTTNEDVLDEFRSLSSANFRPFQAKFKQLDSNGSYYQCLSLLIDTKDEAFKQFRYTNSMFGAHFDIHGSVLIPRLSLLYGNLTKEERKVAIEKVRILDESISRLSFIVTQFALYKINYRDTTLKSWEKIAECNLPLP